MNVCKYKHSTQYTLELNGLENGLDIIRWSKYINIHNAPFFVAPKSTFSYGSPHHQRSPMDEIPSNQWSLDDAVVSASQSNTISIVRKLMAQAVKDPVDFIIRFRACS